MCHCIPGYLRANIQPPLKLAAMFVTLCSNKMVRKEVVQKQRVLYSNFQAFIFFLLHPQERKEIETARKNLLDLERQHQETKQKLEQCKETETNNLKVNLRILNEYLWGRNCSWRISLILNNNSWGPTRTSKWGGGGGRGRLLLTRKECTLAVWKESVRSWMPLSGNLERLERS